ncbi:MAG TPA: hypothetical protein VF937_04305 [Chloroflexota bacterium]
MIAAAFRERRLGNLAPVTFGLTGVVSLGGASYALLQGYPLWVVGLATVAPWLPVFTLGVARTYQRYQWLALFYVLVVTQTGHFFEHVAQMVQVHVLGLMGADARGIFGTLDIEWVHFVWNTWVLLALCVLLLRYAANRWLWLAGLFSVWHEIEHTYIFWVYLTTGVSGTPGLLAQGGALGGGLALARPDLHFLYNLIETVPLLIAFLRQVRRTPAR